MNGKNLGFGNKLAAIQPDRVDEPAVTDAKIDAIGDRQGFVSREPLVKRSRRKPAEPSANLNIRPPVHVFNRFVDFCEKNRYSYPEALDELLKRAGE